LSRGVNLYIILGGDRYWENFWVFRDGDRGSVNLNGVGHRRHKYP